MSDEKSGQEFHPSLRFEYRPMLVSARAALMRRIADLAATSEKGVIESEKVAAEAMVKQLVSWDLAGPTGPAPLNLDSMLRVEPHLSGRLFNVITGGELGDKYEAQEQAELGN